MNAQELFDKYPKAAEVIVKYYSDIFTKSIEESDAPEEFKEIAKQQQVDNGYIIDFINRNPRGTFDVFDENGIYITTPVAAADGYFRWEIHSEAEVYDTSEYLDNRKMAEDTAVEEAFKILNEKL